MTDAEILVEVPVGIVLRAGDRLVANPAVEALTGYPAAALDSIDRWFETLFAEGADVQRVAHERHGANGFPGRVTLRLRRADGRTAIAEMTVRVLADGRELWTLYDITERHLAEERFRILFERSTDAHLLFDANGILDCNQAAVDLLRCRDKAQLLSLHPAVFSPEHQPDGRTSLEKSREMDAIAQRDGFHRFDWIHRKVDGTDFPVEVTLNPVTLHGGRALLVVWHDLTRRKETERALAVARDRAIEATRSKSVFLANMSHELRTPLNAIIGYSELLMDDSPTLTPEIVEDVEKISQAGRHLLTLINDILDLSKIEAGHLSLHLACIELPHLAAEVVESVRPLADRLGNTVQLEIDPGVGAMLADATRIRQVLLNLLGNAVKFTEGGQVGLRVRRAGPDIEFVIWDTGIGIPREQQARIFDEFVQADASTTRKFGGTGLGLAITRRLCERMDGTITVQSEPGSGSVFTVRFPETPAVAAVRPSPRLDVVEPVEPARDAPLVVVIDDDPDARELMRRTLVRGGFRCALAGDGPTGIAMCRQERPAAVTLDVLMPGSDGWQILSAIKADPELASIPVLMVSMLADRSKGFALGASHYLTKPIERDELLKTLARYRPAGGAGVALVVEDDDALRLLVQRTLSRSGWTVHTATNGSEALDALALHPPDIVLLDLMMPVMDGFEFLSTVRSTPRWQNLPVVVVTARDLSPEEFEQLQGQAQRVLGKGLFTADALLRQVELAVTSYAPRAAAK